MKSAVERTRELARRVSCLAPCVLRMAAFACSASIAVVAPALRFADAETGGVFSKREAMNFPGSEPNRARRLHLNGAHVSFRTEVVSAPLGDVLSHYEGLCGSNGARHRGDAGHVACVGVSSARSLGEVVRSLVLFAKRGDFAELGGVRYAFARRVDGGDQTFLLTVWTESGLRVSSLLAPERGDAEGRDPHGVPRPAESRRILSAFEEGAPSGVFVYRVDHQSAAEVAAFYRRVLPTAGWRTIERAASQTVIIDGAHLVSAEREGIVVTIITHADASDATSLTVLTSEQSW